MTTPDTNPAQIAALSYFAKLGNQYDRLSSPIHTLGLLTLCQSFGVDVTDKESPIATGIRRMSVLVDLLNGEIAGVMTHVSMAAGIVPEDEEADLLEELRNVKADHPGMLQKLVNNEA